MIDAQDKTERGIYMKKIFFIVDCSGSLTPDDAIKIEQINDLVRDSINQCISKGNDNINVICYADIAEVYWKSSSTHLFRDIPHEKFGGRSNLGRAYGCVKSLLSHSRIPVHDCITVLISDGEATDNYRLALQTLDGKNESTRLSFSIGTSYSTTLYHASAPIFMFKNGIRDREAFLERLGNVIQDER